MAPAPRYLETHCSSCVLRISAGDTFDDPEFPQFPYVELRILSTHADLDRNRMRGRWARVVDALRTRPQPWIDFSSRADLRRFIDELEHAGEAAFGPPIPQGTQGSRGGPP